MEMCFVKIIIHLLVALTGYAGAQSGKLLILYVPMILHLDSSLRNFWIWLAIK